MPYLCERCGAQFENRREYKEHQTDHMLGRAEEKSVDELVGGEDIVAEPIEETPDLGIPGPTATGQQLEKKRPWDKPEQLRLQYKYTGGCPNCGKDVETLEIDDVLADKKKQVVIAWCGHCHKKLRQRQVSKL
jgi:DNA-directed RNA polymerase subunit RPC12/RpoP